MTYQVTAIYAGNTEIAYDEAESLAYALQEVKDQIKESIYACDIANINFLIIDNYKHKKYFLFS